MTQRVWIVAIAVVIVTAIGVGLLIWTYQNEPLQGTRERTCVGCVSYFWNGTVTIRANRLSGGYVFAEDASYLVSFSDGSVTLADESLTPGCHDGRARAGATLEVNGARELRIRVPAPDGGCAAFTDSSG